MEALPGTESLALLEYFCSGHPAEVRGKTESCSVWNSSVYSEDFLAQQCSLLSPSSVCSGDSIQATDELQQ